MESKNPFEKLMDLMNDVDISSMSESDILQLVSNNLTSDEIEELSEFLAPLMGEVGQMMSNPKEYLFGRDDQKFLMEHEKDKADD